MPKTRLQPIESYSRDEQREESEALRDQIDTLVRLDAAVYSKHIDRSLSALAKTLARIGQELGEKCFLCRKPLVVDGASEIRCADGWESPAAWLRRASHVQ